MNRNNLRWCPLINSCKQWIIKQITRNWKEDALNLDNAEITVQKQNRCKTSRGTTFVNCKPRQPVQLYALLAGLPTALCPGYAFSFSGLFYISLLISFPLSSCHTSGAVGFFPSVAFIPVVPLVPFFRSNCSTVVSTVSSKLALAKAVAAVAHERKAAMAILSPGAATGGWKLKGRAPPQKHDGRTESNGNGIQFIPCIFKIYVHGIKVLQSHWQMVSNAQSQHMIAVSNAGVSMLFILQNLHTSASKNAIDPLRQQRDLTVLHGESDISSRGASLSSCTQGPSHFVHRCRESVQRLPCSLSARVVFVETFGSISVVLPLYRAAVFGRGFRVSSSSRS